ncbi:annexin A7 [Actinomyces oris]|uniref:annexin A7 n=1 Tax=Actinomyces oris TaxID=544580 RepID=UPI002852AFD3|nr:annexin A7 [Actinomyces oris]
MTYPPAYPPPQGHSGPPSPQYPPQAAYGSAPAGAPQGGATYGQAPTPAGHGAYMPPAQSAIPTQSVLRPPGAPPFPGQPNPPAPAHALTPQYQPYQPQQRQFQQFQQGAGSGTGSAYLSGAVTAPGYPSPARPLQVGSPHPGTTSSRPLDAPHQVPWRGLKAATLVMMIVGCALEFVIYITVLFALARGSVWNTAIISTLLFVITTPVIWWHYFGLRHLFHNRPVTEILGLALWFGYGVVTLPIAGVSQDPYAGVQHVTFILLLIVTTVGAILTTRLNQRLRDPQPWPTTLAMGACQFVLINSAVHISYLAISAYVSISAGRGLSNYTTSAWFIWSESGGAGLSVATGLLIFTIVTSLAAAGLFLGMRSPSSASFRIVSTSAVSLLTLYNIVVVLAYGLPTVGEYAFQPSSTGIAMAIIIGQGALLIGSTLMAGRRSAAAPPDVHSRQQYGVAGTAGPHGMQNRFSRQHRSQSQWGTGY